MAPVPAATLSQSLAVPICRSQYHDGAQIAVQPALIGATRARGTSRSASPHPSQLWRSTPAVEPPPSSAGCLQSDRQIHWPTRPHANAPASLHSRQPREIPVPPTNFPAATVAPRFDPCTPVRIEPLPDVRAPKGSNPIRATTSLTQGDRSKVDAWRMIQRRAAELGMRVRIGLPRLPRYRHHGLSRGRRHTGKRAADGSSRGSSHDHSMAAPATKLSWTRWNGFPSEARER